MTVRNFGRQQAGALVLAAAMLAAGVPVAAQDKPTSSPPIDFRLPPPTNDGPAPGAQGPSDNGLPPGAPGERRGARRCGASGELGAGSETVGGGRRLKNKREKRY